MRKPVLALALLVAVGPARAADLAIYDQGPAVVSEHRSIELKPGDQQVVWPGLPRHLLPETLWLQGDGVRLTGSRYDGSLDADALLQRRLGQTVTLLRGDGQGGDVSRQATLLAAGNAPVVEVDGRIEVLDARSPWRIALKELPKTLSVPPGLVLEVAAESPGKRDLRLTYQTDGLGWDAEYVGRYDDEARRLSLSLRANLVNDSGGDFDEAGVALIAGSVNRASGGAPRPMSMRAEFAKSSADVAAQAAFEYYRYVLPDTLTLASGQIRNVTLFGADDIEVEREYLVEGGWNGAGDTAGIHPVIRLHFDNRLGKPLPAGVARIYGVGNPPLLLGEDRIANTPKGEEVLLTLGRVFDITAERRVTDESRDGATRESTRRITVRNAKSKAVKVRIVEHLPGDWAIGSENLPHSKLDASRAAWIVGVPAGGRALLHYQVRWR